jgi:hypothetical protein
MYLREKWFLVLFRRFWPAMLSPLTDILHEGLFGPADHYKSQEWESGHSFQLKRHKFSEGPIKPSKDSQLFYFTEQAK